VKDLRIVNRRRARGAQLKSTLSKPRHTFIHDTWTSTVRNRPSSSCARTFSRLRRGVVTGGTSESAWDGHRTLAVRNIVEPSWVSGTYTTHPRDVSLTAVIEARVGRPAQSLTMCTSTSLTHTRGLRLSVDRLRQTQLLLLRQQHRAGVGGERQRQRLG
jgi:hypothetical protein